MGFITDNIGSILGSAVSLINNNMNLRNQNNINNQNIAFAQREADLMRSREDNAYQRAVADVKEAGLSPLSITGGAQSGSSATPQIQSPMSDLSSLIGIMSSFDALTEQKREFDLNLATEEQKMQNQLLMFSEEMNFKVNTGNKEFDIEMNKLINQQKQFAETMAFNEEKVNKEYIKQSQEKRLQEYQKVCNDLGFKVPIKTCKTMEEYQAALFHFNNNFQNVLDFVYRSNPNVVVKSESVDKRTKGNVKGSLRAGFDLGKIGSFFRKGKTQGYQVTDSNTNGVSGEISAGLETDNGTKKDFDYSGETKALFSKAFKQYDCPYPILASDYE